MKALFSVTLFLACILIYSQEITGKDLLEKAINYHDPNGEWQTFKGCLFIIMKTPDKPDRDSKVCINLPNETFSLKATRDKQTFQYIIVKDSVQIRLNGNANLSEDDLKENNLSDSRAKLFRNYYTFLYGLPMKLNDPGTHIDQNVQDKTFKGKDYWVLKVTYDEKVGSDIWYFYFDKSNYRMEVYQFYRDESKNDGEYILLSEEEIIGNIKMPKIRAWYMNKDDNYLGTDFLNSASKNQ